MYYHYFYKYLKCIGYLPIAPKYLPWIISIIYPILIFILICFPFVSTLVQYIITKPTNQILLSSLFFYTIAPIQFLLGRRYIRQPHFKSIILDSKRIQWIKLPQQIKLVIGIIIIATLITIINIIIWGTSFNTHSPDAFPNGFDYLVERLQENFIENININNINNGTSIPSSQITNNYPDHGINSIIALMIFYWIYTWQILITNVAIFCLIFSKHLHDIITFKDFLESDIIWKMDQTSFTGLTRQMISLRYVINQSVEALEGFYTITTVLGSIAIGPIIESKKIDAYLAYNVVKFFLIQIIFMYFLYNIPKSREDLLKIIKSPSIMFKYLTNIKSMQNIQALREYKNNTIQQPNENSLEKSQRLSKINSCRIAAYSPVTFGNGLDLDNVNTDGSAVDLEKSDAELELLTLSYKNNAAIDWMILHQVLSEKWASFNLLGVSFDNTDVIKKGFGVISIIILASSYFNSLSFV
tara:strand:+ start:19472 stop:20881 length:1410 start_codon:yes stop_codon:yes gene_type:complete